MSSPSSSTPAVVERAAQPYVAIRGAVTMTTIGEVADRFGEVFDLLGRQGVEPAGPPFLRYRVIDMERQLVLEAGVPVPSADVRVEGDVLLDALPAGRYAEVTHHGHPDGLVDATAALLAWAEAAGLTWDVREGPDGEVWGSRLERYLDEPGQPMDDWDTELAFRLAD
jgi:effector-binding domain-containing protein